MIRRGLLYLMRTKLMRGLRSCFFGWGIYSLGLSGIEGGLINGLVLVSVRVYVFEREIG